MLRDSVTRRQSVARMALEIAVTPPLGGRIASRVSRGRLGRLLHPVRVHRQRSGPRAPGASTAAGELFLDMSGIGNIARRPEAGGAIELPKSEPPSLGFRRGPRP